MTGGATLIQGQSLRLPAGVVKSSHNASTFKTYDPGEINGDLSPTTIRPQNNAAGKKGCGGFGAILLVVIAIAVTVVTAGAAVAALGPTGMTLGAGIQAVLGGSLAGLAGTGAAGFAVATGIAAGSAAVDSIVSQAVGVATGIQEKFSWNAVALAAIGGGVGGGLGNLAKGATKIGAALSNGLVRGVTSSVISQGIGVATGLQDEFSWVGVAAAGVGGYVGGIVGAGFGPNQNFGEKLVTSGVSALANAATRSALNGSSFEDNLIAAIPDVIGSAIGGAIGGSFGGAEQNNNPANADKGFSLERAGQSARGQLANAPGAFLDLGVGAAREGVDAVRAAGNYFSDTVNDWQASRRTFSGTVSGNQSNGEGDLISYDLGANDGTLTSAEAMIANFYVGGSISGHVFDGDAETFFRYQKSGSTDLDIAYSKAYAESQEATAKGIATGLSVTPLALVGAGSMAAIKLSEGDNKGAAAELLFVAPFLKPIKWAGGAIASSLKYVGKGISSAAGAVGRGLGVLKNAAGSIYRNAKNVAVAGVKRVDSSITGFRMRRAGVTSQLGQHIFGKNLVKHQTQPLLDAFGGDLNKAALATNKVAQKAFRQGKISFKSDGSGIVDSTVNNVITVKGISVNVIGGRIVNGKFNFKNASLNFN